MERKMKAVWLCHFSSAEVQEQMGISGYNEVAPWVPMAIRTIEACPWLEVYVVFPHPGVIGVKSFDLRGVHYTAFSFPHSKLHRFTHNKYFCSSEFCKSKKIVGEIVNQINPDVVHCFGAECGEISATFIPLMKKYPSILSVQGFIYKTNLPKRGTIKARIKIEKDILTNIKVAFTESKKQGEDIRQFNPDIKLYWHFWGSYEILPAAPQPEKIYDLVFFARLQKDKGLCDLIDAVAILKQWKPDIRLCVIGGGDVESFRRYAGEAGVAENVEFTGFLPTREDVHLKAQQGRVSVLPTYNDINPGTIVESMFLGIPVVTSDVDTNPEVNEKGEVLKLFPVGNVQALADAIRELLSNPEVQKRLSEGARKRAYEMYAPTDEYLRQCLLNGYKCAIEEFDKR